MRRTGLHTVLIPIILCAWVLSACGKQEYKPVAVHEHTDRCAICNMSVTDDPHATQIIKKDGQPLLFDDLGCLYEWISQNGRDEIGVAFVRDYHTKEWIKLEDAYYVYDPSIRTPMAYGVISFSDKNAAQDFIDQEAKSGMLMDAAQLDNHKWERGGSGHHGHDDGHGASHHNGNAGH